MDNATYAYVPPSYTYGYITYAIILIVFGTIGNLLLLLTLFHKRFGCAQSSAPATEMTELGARITSAKSVIRPRPTQTGPQRLSVADELLVLLTATDTLCLWIIVVRYLITLSTYYDLRNYSLAACKIHLFVSMVLSDSSVAILCIFATHRAISIRYPLSVHTWLTRGRMRICIGSAFLFIVSKHLPVFALFTVLESETGLRCDVRRDTVFYNQIYYNFEFLTHAALGYLCLIAANICLCVSLAYARRVQAANAVVGQKPHPSGLRIAKIILLLSIIQLITSVPFFILIELSGLYELHLLSESTEPIVYYALTLTTFSNCGINFYVLLLISERFRQDGKAMFRQLTDRFSCHKEEKCDYVMRKQSDSHSELL